MRCVICQRQIARAAATMPAGHDKAEPFKAGPVGPTCARRAGLMAAPSLFDRRAKVTTTRRRKSADNRQAVLL